MVKKNLGGRPAGRTKDRQLQMRVDEAWIVMIDDWRKQQPGELLTRTEAIRRLVELGLTASSRAPKK